MPRHHQSSTCRKGNGQPSKLCTCEAQAPDVCGVCSASAGALTTDCPGAPIDLARQQEILETQLDYTDARGWHLIDAAEKRMPRFGHTKVPREPHTDPREVVAPGIDWLRVDRTTDLQRELAMKAIEWVVADRKCEDQSAALARVQDEAEELRGKAALTDREKALHAKLERAKIDFHLACDRAERRDDEFRQMARRLVAALEQGSPFKDEGTPES